MIKKYNQFLKESNWYDNLSFEEILSEIGNENGMNYSILCKTNNSPEKDFENFQNHLNETGWTIKKIRNKYSDVELISIYRSLDNINGLVDIYFYKLFEKFGINKDIVELGGSGWNDIWVTEDEASIRYSYGYHNTEYGMLFINQINGGLDAFLKQAFSYIKTFIIEEFSLNILNIYVSKGVNFDKITGLQKNWHYNSILDINDYSLIESDRMVIYANEIANYLNNISTTDGKKLSDYLELRSNDIYDVLKLIGKKFKTENEYQKIDLDFTGGDIIIWYEFEN
jgi:hypothetical protein